MVMLVLYFMRNAKVRQHVYIAQQKMEMLILFILRRQEARFFHPVEFGCPPMVLHLLVSVAPRHKRRHQHRHRPQRQRQRRRRRKPLPNADQLL